MPEGPSRSRRGGVVTWGGRNFCYLCGETVGDKSRRRFFMLPLTLQILAW